MRPQLRLGPVAWLLYRLGRPELTVDRFAGDVVCWFRDWRRPWVGRLWDVFGFVAFVEVQLPGEDCWRVFIVSSHDPGEPEIFGKKLSDLT